MEKRQREILEELKEISGESKHSIKRRDSSNKLYQDCIKYFGSFNKAKEKAGLDIRNVRILNFPKKVFKKDKDLAKIASYLVFDGHLYNDLSGFYFSSKNINDLKKFEKIVKRKFGIKGKYYLNNGGIAKNTHKFIVFNKKICNKLLSFGIPKGDKVAQKFNVPKWISSSKEFSREYLKIAFFCEGSIKEELKRKPRIQINIAKIENHINSGLEFMDTLKNMLKKFNINTTKCYVWGKRLRKKDNKISKDIRFRIVLGDNNKFIKEIGWIK